MTNRKQSKHKVNQIIRSIRKNDHRRTNKKNTHNVIKL